MEARVVSNADLTTACALFDAGRLDEAAEMCRALLARDVGDIAALHLLGQILLLQGAAAEAVPLLESVAAQQPDAMVLTNLGEALRIIGLTDEAEARFRAALAQQPDTPVACFHLGCILQARGERETALHLLRRAVAGRPDLPDPWLELGNLMLERDEPEQAEHCFRSAIALRPDFVEALNNLGNALVAQHRLQEAWMSYSTALTLRPSLASTGFAYALALLTGGDFSEGWKQFEARRGVGPLRWNYERRLEIPQWRHGASLDGKRVLLMAEQGSGDIIQFARYVPLLAARGAQVVLELPRDMQPLFTKLPGVTRMVDLTEPAPECEISCAVMSLALYFGTTPETIPATVPYAGVLPERSRSWRGWLGPARSRRIGLVCSGRPEHPHDRNRSLPLARLAPILAVPGCEFVLVQQQLRERDRAMLAATPMLRWPGEALRDFGDTAALLAELDLLISVDTSVAHLAGALARPTWVMLPFAPDWRWMLGRCDSPWYPTMRLYRQPTRGDWDSVIAAVRQDLDVPR